MLGEDFGPEFQVIHNSGSVPKSTVFPVMADFGQTDFGQPFLLPCLAKPTVAKTDCGQTEFDLCVVLCCVLSVWRGYCVGTVWVLVSEFVGPPFPGPPFPWTALPLDHPSPGPPTPWTAQNVALFFPSPAAKFVLFFPLWVSSR